MKDSVQDAMKGLWSQSDLKGVQSFIQANAEAFEAVRGFTNTLQQNWNQTNWTANGRSINEMQRNAGRNADSIEASSTIEENSQSESQSKTQEKEKGKGKDKNKTKQLDDRLFKDIAIGPKDLSEWEILFEARAALTPEQFQEASKSSSNMTVSQVRQVMSQEKEVQQNVAQDKGQETEQKPEKPAESVSLEQLTTIKGVLLSAVDSIKESTLSPDTTPPIPPSEGKDSNFPLPRRK